MHDAADDDVCCHQRSVQLFHRHDGSGETVVVSLRITAGSLRGRRVAVPPRDVRPTSERARQAYFNIVGARIEGARFLDLFAGSGIFSFEAVSRGAASSTAIEENRKYAGAIEALVKEWEAPVDVMARDVFKAL